MMEIELKLVCPSGLVVDKKVESVVLPGVQGDLQVMYGHTPLFAALRVGPLEIMGPDAQKVAVHEGLAEIERHKVTVLANAAEAHNQIDRERAESAKQRAEKRLKEAPENSEINYRRAEMALKRAGGRRILVEE